MRSSYLFSQYYFLKGMASIYLFAFISIFVQIPGLYGADGILPYSSFAEAVDQRFGVEKYSIVPSLLWYSDYAKPVLHTLFPSIASFDNYENLGHFICLLGICISLGILWERNTHFFTNSVCFFILWVCYLSIYTFGQTFTSFQWDIFLLETGFLTIFYIPAKTKTNKEYHDPMSIVVKRLLQWLSFRFFFCSGVVKLMSNCPTWWSLTALNYHFESQCIPHALSWYAHHLPEIVKKYLVVLTYITLMFGSLLFYVPFRQVRLAGVFMQFCMQISIIATGNYNFFQPSFFGDVTSYDE